MKILKAPVSPSTIAALNRQGEVTGAPAIKENDSRSIKPAEARGGKTYAYNPEQVESAIRQLDKRRAFAEEGQAQRYAAQLDNRARLALNAYQAQQNLPQEEAQTALRQILGVDYYA